MGLWRVSGTSSECVEASWPDGSVIYQPWDGKLLAISFAGASVWRSLLNDGDATTAVISERLLDGSSDPADLLQLDGLLNQLAELNLVECVDP